VYAGDGHGRKRFTTSRWWPFQPTAGCGRTGKFVHHCHILAHEDFGMMSVIEVVE
jgi:hypothetical protein